MKKHKNTIVINGRRYNAKTGEDLAGSAQPAAATPHEPVQPAVHRTVGRKPAGHITPHAPKPTQTLMRQAVKKPSASLKRRIKVQSHLGVPATPAHSRALSHTAPKPARHTVQHPATARKGQLISHFSPDLFTNVTHVTVTLQPVTPIKPAESSPAPVSRKPRTTAELLDYAVQHANSPAEAPAHRSHRRLFKRHLHPAGAR